jgi:hypothetical protein
MTIFAKPICHAEVSQYVSYDPITGKFIWLKNYSSRRAGTFAGTKKKDGGIYIHIKGNSYQAARLAWVLVHGSIYEGIQIDHINRIRDDNRLCNLRLATASENMRNRRTSLGEKTARHYTQNKSGSFQVQIRGKYIGCVDTVEKAKAMAQKAKEQMP